MMRQSGKFSSILHGIQMIENNKFVTINLTEGENSKLQAHIAEEKAVEYFETPEMSDAWFQQAKRATQLPKKSQVSLRIDEDILEFFKQQGSRYQTKMHAVLRAYVDGHKLEGKKLYRASESSKVD